MEITAAKTIAFKLNEQENSELLNALNLFKIDYPNLTMREIIVLFSQKASEAVTALTNLNQEDNSTLLVELQEENQSLLERNLVLTEKNQELIADNEGLLKTNESITKSNLELISSIKQLEEENENAKNEARTIELPQLTPFQIIVELNHFQLRLAAKVANAHQVESLYNKQSQKNPIAFSRLEGQPKDRIAQLLKNTFFGVQFNYHKGNSYLPENVLTSSDIIKAAKYHEENQ